ncbi:MAG: SDR family oxidoreductase [Saprospiraceae bacterium]|nr:SDR family oxidoreductase [Saprospiraceae bacterium]
MRNYLVVGGSSGIGEALTEILGQSHRVYATYNSHQKSNDGNVSYHPLNVLSDTFDLSFLPEKLDGVAYCPGSILLKPFHRFKDEDFMEDYKLQALGAVKTVRQVLPMIKSGDHPSIVFFSTIAVQRGFNFHSLVSMSKGAIEGLTRSLAAELSPTIRINAVAPALTDTPLAAKLLNTPEKSAAHAEKNPLKKVGTPQDIAATAAYLLSPQSGWITGQIFHVDGGFSSIIK